MNIVREKKQKQTNKQTKQKTNKQKNKKTSNHYLIQPVLSLLGLELTLTQLYYVYMFYNLLVLMAIRAI